jgi:hypothetical protein
MFVYNPTNNFNTAVLGNPDIYTSQYNNREIIDIREASEFTYTLPYSSVVPWLKSQQMNVTTTGTGEACGLWYLYVLNELTAPDTVSNTVTILIEVSGGPDLEFSIPLDYPMLSPTMLNYAQSAPIEVSGRNACSLVEKAVGGSKEERQQIVFSELCIGESIGSFRTLLKRMVPTYFPGGTVSSYQIRPFTITVQSYVATSGYNLDFLAGDYWSVISPLFAYSRGSVRLKYIFSNSSGEPVYNFLTFDDSSSSPVLDSAYTYPNCPQFNSHVVLANVMDACCELLVPQYHQYHTRLIQPNSQSHREPIPSDNTNYFRVATVFPPSFSFSKVFRGAGDDYSLGYFLGVPAMIVDPQT